MRWLRVKVAGIALAACVGVPIHAQHRDQALYDQVQRQEEHLKATDADVKANSKDIMELREQIEAYKDYALGFGGAITLAVGILKFLGRKEEQSA